MKTKILSLLIIYFSITQATYPSCRGRFVNPITDICWSCIFPITIGGFRVSANGEDTPNRRDLICKSLFRK